MNKIAIVFVILTIFITPFKAYAQDEFSGEIPEGMEAIRIGGSGWVIIPKGAKARKIGAHVIFEGDKEYMSRRFKETDEHIEKIEQQLEELLQIVELMKANVEILSAKILNLETTATENVSQEEEVVE